MNSSRNAPCRPFRKGVNRTNLLQVDAAHNKENVNSNNQNYVTAGKGENQSEKQSFDKMMDKTKEIRMPAQVSSNNQK